MQYHLLRLWLSGLINTNRLTSLFIATYLLFFYLFFSVTGQPSLYGIVDILAILSSYLQMLFGNPEKGAGSLEPPPFCKQYDIFC